METTVRLKKGIEAIDGLTILGYPSMSVFAYASRDKNLDIYAVGDQLEERGWLIDRVQHPSALHCMVTPRHAGVVDNYLKDLREAVEIVRHNPGLASKGNAAIYGMVANVPLRGLVKSQVTKMMAELYGPECKMPAQASDSQQSSGLERHLLPIGMKIINWLGSRKNRVK